jgi:dual-specificity kinase
MNGTAAAGSSSKKRKADDGGGRAEKVVKTLPSGGESSSSTHRTTGQQQHQYPVVASGITSSSSGAHRSNNHHQHQQHHAPLFPPSAPPAQPAWDDPEGHYIIQPGDMIYSRYRVVRKLGEGTFGKVVEAIEQTSKKSYAIKIIRAVQKYRDASKIEIRVLNALKDGDPNNQQSVFPFLSFILRKSLSSGAESSS